MSENHEAVAALPVSANAQKQLLRDALVQRMPYSLRASDDPQELVETDPQSGAIITDILYLGRVFHYDATDSTTPHDGTTCLVTAGDKRYKLASGTDVFAYSVINSIRTAPPASPTIGDAYRIASPATGAWSGHSNDITVYTARGWEFIEFGIGRFYYDEATDAYYHKDSGGTWTLGFGTQTLGSGTVAPSAMIGGGARVRFIVENQTTNTPPAVVDGRAYIIGPSPTGDWSGHSAKIAHGENGAWVIYTPAEGWRAYDKALDKDYLHNGSGWISGTGAPGKPVTRTYTASTTWSKPARLLFVKVWVVGSGGGAASGGGSASFGAHVSATGGGSTGGGGTAGTGSNGDVNNTGETDAQGASSVASFGIKGRGTAGGGGGGSAYKWVAAADLASNVSITIGTSGANNGFVVVEEWTEA